MKCPMSSDKHDLSIEALTVENDNLREQIKRLNKVVRKMQIASLEPSKDRKKLRIKQMELKNALAVIEQKQKEITLLQYELRLYKQKQGDNQ